MRMPCFSVRRRQRSRENNVQQQLDLKRQQQQYQNESQQMKFNNYTENLNQEKNNHYHNQHNQQMAQDWSFDDYDQEYEDQEYQDQNPKHALVQLSSIKQLPTQQKKNKMLLQSRKRLLHKDKVVGTALEQTVTCQIGSFWKLELNFWSILTFIALIVFIILAFTTGARLNKLEKQLKGVQKLFLMQKMTN